MKIKLIYIHVYTHTHTHTYIHAYIYIHICMYIHMYLHAHTHTYVHTYTHSKEYTYTYVFLFRFFSIIRYYKILSIIPCTRQKVRTIYLFHTQQHVYVNPKLLIYPSPTIPFSTEFRNLKNFFKILLLGNAQQVILHIVVE